MKIAFDVDGVLTDLQKFQIENGYKFFQKQYGMGIINQNGANICEIFDCSKEQEYKFWKRNIIYYSKKWPIRNGAMEVIKNLQNDGNEIYIITSRIKTCDHDFIGFMMRCFLKKWLKKNGIIISDSNIRFCSIENSANEKRKVCEELGIDYMVDDDIKNLSEIKKVSKAICFDTPSNMNERDNYINSSSFYEIHNIISLSYDEKIFRYKKRDELSKMSSSEKLQYYKELRNYYLSRFSLNGIEKKERHYLKLYNFLKSIFDYKYKHNILNESEIPKEDGIIYVINHKSMTDCPLIMSAIGKRNIHLLLKAEFLDTKFGGFLKSIGSVFVDRGNKDSEIAASEELTNLVLNNKNVLICPEGTRNKTDDILLPFKSGAVTIAQRTGHPIVPVMIHNVSGKINIEFGKKMYVSEFDDIYDANDNLQNYMSERLIGFKQEKMLLKKEYR